MGSLRIIAGTLKGRKFQVPDLPGVRPTPDRAREALFSILGESVAGARVLDAYAGTGALGLEAFSRGASSVTFLEADRQVHRALEGTLAALGLTAACRAVLGPAERFPVSILKDAPFDLILADPPYGAGAGRLFLVAVSEQDGLAADGARLVLERESGEPPAGEDGTRFRQVRTARYGRTALDFYTLQSAPEPRPA